MALYAYRCQQCDNTFHVRKGMNELDSESCCPNCGSAKTYRLISAVAVFAASGGERRVLVGPSGCSGCASVGSGCAGCRPR